MWVICAYLCIWLIIRNRFLCIGFLHTGLVTLAGARHSQTASERAIIVTNSMSVEIMALHRRGDQLLSEANMSKYTDAYTRYLAPVY